jgi:hypothetical protein
MRLGLFTILATTIGAPLAAHPTHIGPLLGHDHWIAIGAMAAAAAIALAAGLKGRGAKDSKKPAKKPAKRPAEEAKA